MRMYLYSEGQPESIVQDIETMVRSYVEKVMSINIQMWNYFVFMKLYRPLCLGHWFLQKYEKRKLRQIGVSSHIF